jgi:hypothetical protein
LLHGPVRTGKTECAKPLAVCTGCKIGAIGEADEAGGEPAAKGTLDAYRNASRPRWRPCFSMALSLLPFHKAVQQRVDAALPAVTRFA